MDRRTILQATEAGDDPHTTTADPVAISDETVPHLGRSAVSAMSETPKPGDSFDERVWRRRLRLWTGLRWLQ